MHALRGLTIHASTDEVLAILRTNREQHGQIVVEARQGYMAKATEAIEKRLAELRDGKLVDLSFKLRPPVDHTKTYDTAIKALEMHQTAGSKTIALDATQVRHFIEDEWDWMDEFLLSNAGYSPKSRELAATKGLV